MAEEREFCALAVASIWSGFVLTDNFSDIENTMEALAGGKIWRHQIPAMRKTLGPHIADCAPEIAAFDYSKINRETADKERDRFLAAVGPKVMMQTPLLDGYEESPMEGLPRSVPVDVIKV